MRFTVDANTQLINDLGTGLYLWQVEEVNLSFTGREEGLPVAAEKVVEKAPPTCQRGKISPPRSQMAAAADC